MPRKRPRYRMVYCHEDSRQPHLKNCARRANEAHLAVINSLRTTLDEAKRAGEALLSAKAHCFHGEWTKWLQENFKASEETARVYMRVAGNWRVLEKISPEPRKEKPLSLAEALELLRTKKPKPSNWTKPEPTAKQTLLNQLSFFISKIWSKEEVSYLASGSSFDDYLLELQVQIAPAVAIASANPSRSKLLATIKQLPQNLTDIQTNHVVAAIADSELEPWDYVLNVAPLFRDKVSDPSEWLCEQDYIA